MISVKVLPATLVVNYITSKKGLNNKQTIPMIIFILFTNNPSIKIHFLKPQKGHAMQVCATVLQSGIISNPFSKMNL